MKTRHPLRFFLFLAILSALGAWNAAAQQKNLPHIGFIFPAGAQRGSTAEITLGGQFMDGAKEVLVYGAPGVKGTVVKVERPLPQKRVNELRDYLTETRKKYQEEGRAPAELRGLDKAERTALILKESGATDDEIKLFLMDRKQRSDPKRQQNMQIAESVIAKIEVAPDAPLGPRELRVLTPNGVSNPLAFCVGNLPEQRRVEPLEKAGNMPVPVIPPVVLNGQILPGAVDRYSFPARSGEHLVVAVQARDLIPYLADAVPGWFQPVVAIYDGKGKEVAYARDFRFSPDPVFCCDVPEDGTYTLEVRDALYRGREDFVYRITVGEVPFITGIFPMGARVGAPASVHVAGWNLAQKKAILKPVAAVGVQTAEGLGNGRVIGDTPFAVDALPEVMEEEPNNTRKQVQRVRVPVIINGHIGAPGDVDGYAFYGVAGAKMVAEVEARRLNSPLDSWLKVTDENGRQLAFNDDCADAGSGLLTHKADSYLSFTLPATGTYLVHIGDAQHKGGAEYAYRLRISPAQPDYALRMTPSSVNGRQGFSTPVTVYALRKDGFTGDIALALKNPPPGFSLEGGLIQEGQDKVRATITMPGTAINAPVALAVEGSAQIGGRTVNHLAVPAEDMLQAFAYHHLVPAAALVGMTNGGGRNKPLAQIDAGAPLQLLAGAVGHAVLAALQGGKATEFRFELSEPPDGVTIDAITPVNGALDISIRAGAAAKPGMSGNLILEAFIERMQPAKDGKPEKKVRYSVGYLPAIPFKVVAQ